MKKILKLALLAGVTLSLASQAFAQCGGSPPAQNCPPPPGAILDLNGMAIPNSYQQYSVSFIAADPTTNISFAIREDPAFFALDDISMVDTTTPSGELIANGGFEAGPVGAAAPTGWTYLNTFSASFPGFVDNGTHAAVHSGSNEYYDGAVQAYDGISQAVGTTVNDHYTISFWLYDTNPAAVGGPEVFSDISTNGDTMDTQGNGRDVLVYAGGIPNLTTPEPGSFGLLAGGLVFAAGFLRRKKVI